MTSVHTLHTHTHTRMELDHSLEKNELMKVCVCDMTSDLIFSLRFVTAND